MGLKFFRLKLNHRIRDRIERLGATLFDRSRRAVRLTAAGQILLRSAHDVLRELGEAKRSIAELTQLQGGHLRIGILPSINVCVSPEFIRQFVKKCPKINLSVAELESDELVAQLLTGKVDLGLGYCPAPDKAIESTVLAEERLIGLVPPGHRFARIKRAAFNGFIEGPIVVLSRRPRIDQNRLNGAATAIIETASVEDALSTIRQSGFAAILPDHAVCRERNEDLTRIVFRGFPWAIRKIAFWRTHGSCGCYAVTAFIELARRIRSECFPD